MDTGGPVALGAAWPDLIGKSGHGIEMVNILFWKYLNQMNVSCCKSVFQFFRKVPPIELFSKVNGSKTLKKDL